MRYGHASTKLTKTTTRFDVFENRVLGENFPTTKKTSSPPPPYPTVEYAAVTDNAIFKFW